MLVVARRRQRSRRRRSHAAAARSTRVQALERFRAIIERQGGDPRVIDDYSLMPHAPAEHVIRRGHRRFRDRPGRRPASAAPSVVLGGGRDKVDDEIDPAVGIMIPATGGRRRAAPAIPCCACSIRSERATGGCAAALMEAVRVGESPDRRRRSSSTRCCDAAFLQSRVGREQMTTVADGALRSAARAVVRALLSACSPQTYAVSDPSTPRRASCSTSAAKTTGRSTPPRGTA